MVARRNRSLVYGWLWAAAAVAPGLLTVTTSPASSDLEPSAAGIAARTPSRAESKPELPSSGDSLLGTRRSSDASPIDWQRYASSSLEAGLISDAADGQLDQHTLLEAALIAGAARDRDTIRKYQLQFTASCDAYCREVRVPADATLRAASLLSFLHQRILDGQYAVPCNDVGVGLSDGDFNCVTATVLFQCLCHHFEVPVTAEAGPQHVRSRLLGEHPIAVETTCRDWFAGSRPNPYAAGVGLPEQSAGPRRWRDISDVQLVAKIYYNRAVSLLQQRRYETALPMARLAWQLDADHARARDNLLAALNNWALACCDAGDFQGAQRLLQAGRRIDPRYIPLAVNETYLRQQRRLRSGRSRVFP